MERTRRPTLGRIDQAGAAVDAKFHADDFSSLALASLYVVIATVDQRSARLAGSLPLVCLSVGIALTTFAESGWAHAVRIGCLCACAASAFVFFPTIGDE